jgi:hypothetical protein
MAECSMKHAFTKMIILALFVVSSFCVILVAKGADQSVTVQANVPSAGGGGGGGGGGGDQSPSLFNVNSSTTYTSAQITWEATDDRGIESVVFVYGLSTAYGSSGNVTGNYQTTLVSLATGTIYYYKISVTDTGLHTVEYAGSFSTQASPIPPPDTTAPTITNVQVSTGVTTATITWVTNENADSQILYGNTVSYGSNYFDPTQTLSHSVLLFNLDPNTFYHFQIVSTDAAGNSSSTADITFTTKADIVPPPDVSNFILTTTSNSIVLSWTNPSLVGTPDFNGVRVLRKIGGSSSGLADGVQVYSGSAETFTDTSVAVNTNYFYTIFSIDTSGNTSPGVFRNGQIVPASVPVEICGNGIDDNSNGLIDCADMACSALSQCASTSTPPAEICGNGIDDNSNGLIDCADAACSALSACSNTPVNAVCGNGLDDDSDGLVDFPADKGCSSITDTDEYNAPESTVPSFEKININDVQFLTANRKITLAITGNTIMGLQGAGLTVAVPEDKLYAAPRTMVLQIGDTDRHQFIYSATAKEYIAEVSFARIGIAQAYIEIDYGGGQQDAVGFSIRAVPMGKVLGGNSVPLEGAEIILKDGNGNPFSMGEYGQLNPIYSDADGNFGWMVPNGSYVVTVRKNNFYERTVNISNVANNIISQNFTLIAEPEKLVLAIDPDLSIQDNVKNIAGSVVKQTKVLSNVAVQKIQDAATDPEVKKVNETIVAPAVITTVVVGAAPLISWLDFVPFLRLLFLQPLMLLGWRRREKWGLVYNTLSKLPIDLAMVRLVNAETGKVVQSKVTDSKGRFIFTVGPGKYKIHVQKNTFIFPSQFLADYKNDGQKAEIYHGEIIEVRAPSSITAIIPLDPAGAQKKPVRLVWEKIARRAQTFVSVLGIVITAGSLYISPKWYVGVLLGVHVAFFFLFRKLALPPKIKNWGIVYDQSTKAPISRVVARLFNAQFNKLVDTQITDGSGKYYFMAGDARFYVTYEHKEYHPQKTDIINLEGKESEAITAEVALKKS